MPKKTGRPPKKRLNPELLEKIKEEHKDRSTRTQINTYFAVLGSDWVKQKYESTKEEDAQNSDIGYFSEMSEAEYSALQKKPTVLAEVGRMLEESINESYSEFTETILCNILGRIVETKTSAKDAVTALRSLRTGEVEKPVITFHELNKSLVAAIAEVMTKYSFSRKVLLEAVSETLIDVFSGDLQQLTEELELDNYYADDLDITINNIRFYAEEYERISQRIIADKRPNTPNINNCPTTMVLIGEDIQQQKDTISEEKPELRPTHMSKEQLLDLFLKEGYDENKAIQLTKNVHTASGFLHRGFKSTLDTGEAMLAMFNGEAYRNLYYTERLSYMFCGRFFGKMFHEMEALMCAFLVCREMPIFPFFPDAPIFEKELKPYYPLVKKFIWGE